MATLPQGGSRRSENLDDELTVSDNTRAGVKCSHQQNGLQNLQQEPEKRLQGTEGSHKATSQPPSHACQHCPQLYPSMLADLPQRPARRPAQVMPASNSIWVFLY